MSRSMNQLILAVVVIRAIALGAQDGSDAAAQLRSEHPQERVAAFKRILSGRKSRIQQLLSIVDDPEVDNASDGPLYYAITLLGELRAAEAVRSLSARLTYLPKGPLVVTTAVPSEAYYVAANALRQIGQPSIKPMFLVIRKSDNETERNLAAWVVMQVEGKEQALPRIERRIAVGRAGQAHFEEAKRYIETYRPSFRYPGSK